MNNPSWKTPDFNPNMEDTFKPYSFIKPSMKPIQLPNGQFVTPEQYQQLLAAIQQRK